MFFREDFLQFLWKNRLIPCDNLVLSSGKWLRIVSFGEISNFSRPDIFNLRCVIDGIEWAGCGEIHVYSSDWYRHNHHVDKCYDNIILHVVWERDVDVFDSRGNAIETLELKNYVNEKFVDAHESFTAYKCNFIACERQVRKLVGFDFESFYQKKYLERLKNKAEVVKGHLRDSGKDWEKVLFVMISRVMGGNVNGGGFEKVGKSLPFGIVKRCSEVEDLEGLLFGSANLLGGENTDSYEDDLKKRYEYLKHKYEIDGTEVRLDFFGLRPQNFPTIRISQLANLYFKNAYLFDEVVKMGNVGEFFDLIKSVETSDYWKGHYVFGKESKGKSERISKSMAELMWINAILPIQYTYQESVGNVKDDEFVRKAKEVKGESNSIITKMNEIGFVTRDMMESQAVIELYKNGCEKKACVGCEIWEKCSEKFCCDEVRK